MRLIETVKQTITFAAGVLGFAKSGSALRNHFDHASSLLLHKVTIMATFNPYSSPPNNSEKTPVNLRPNMYARSTPKPDLDPATIAFINGPKAAMVQAAVVVRDLQYWERTFAKLAVRHTSEFYALTKEFIDSGVWREHYKTKAAALEHVPKISSDCYYKGILKLLSSGSTERVPQNNNEAELECLKAIEEARSKWQTEQSKPEQDTQTSAPEAAKEASQAAPETTPEPTPEPAKEASRPPIDVSGCVIPQRLLENDLRERHGEVTGAAHWASKLKTLFEGIQNNHDPLFVNLKASGNIQTFMNGAASMHRAISECLPEVVCPQCSAKTKTCHLCHGSGWISEVRWNRDWVKAADSVKQTEVRRRAAIKAEYA